MRIVGIALLFIGLCGLASAIPTTCIVGTPCGVPEMDPSAGGSALALLSGAVLILRSRRTRSKGDSN